MSIRLQMREADVRESYDGGEFALPEVVGKVPAPGASLLFLEGFGWKMDGETARALPVAVRLADEVARVSAEVSAAEERMLFWERDSISFDAAAVLEAGSFTKAELWSRTPPDVDALRYELKVLKVALDVAKRDFVTSVAADPKFEEKADLVWNEGVMGGDEETMTGKELRHYLAAASTVRQHLLALVTLQGAGVGMTPLDQKRLRAAFSEDGPRCPTVPRMRAVVEAGELERKTAAEEAEKEVRVRREAEVAMAARYRNPRAKEVSDNGGK